MTQFHVWYRVPMLYKCLASKLPFTVTELDPHLIYTVLWTHTNRISISSTMSHVAHVPNTRRHRNKDRTTSDP